MVALGGMFNATIPFSNHTFCKKETVVAICIYCGKEPVPGYPCSAQGCDPHGHAPWCVTREDLAEQPWRPPAGGCEHCNYSPDGCPECNYSGQGSAFP